MPEWVIEYFDGVSVGTLITRAAVLATVISLIFKVWPAIKKIVATTDALNNLPDISNKINKMHEDQIPKMEEKLERVHHEVFPNSGRSLRDEVNRASISSQRTERTLDRMESRVGPLTGEIRQLRSDVDDHLEETKDLIKEYKNGSTNGK